MLHVIELDTKYSAGHVAPYPITITQGQGIYVFDQQKKRYLDFTSGISVVNFGHQHPRLLNALLTQARKIAIVPRIYHNEPLAYLLQKACELTEMDKAIPMNSGAEAIETAIKVARKWGYLKKNISQNKAEIIVCLDSFHGRTTTTISMSSVAKYKNDFGPLTPGFISVPFNDLDALAAAITPNTVAFIVEPIQGEAGVELPKASYLKHCEQLCRENNVLFILDEIQTGMGRTGKFLAAQHDALNPDGLLLGKALGGGLLPISLFLAKDSVMEVLKPGEHGSTFGGNPLAAFVAYEALNTLIDDKLPENAAIVGEYFLNALKRITNPAIIGVRGKGLMIGIEINTQLASSKSIVDKLIQKGLLAINTRDKIIRLLPPLTVTNSQIVNEAIPVIEEVFKQ